MSMGEAVYDTGAAMSPYYNGVIKSCAIAIAPPSLVFGLSVQMLAVKIYLNQCNPGDLFKAAGAWIRLGEKNLEASDNLASEVDTITDDNWSGADSDAFKSSASRIYVFGRSLGSGVAVQLAAQRPVAGLILVAPFDSLVAVGKRHYPFLPVDWMLKHRFDSVAIAPKIRAPLLCIVAGDDEIIPAVHAKRLYDAWGGDKRWVELMGASHNSTDHADDYWKRIIAFLK